ALRGVVEAVPRGVVAIVGSGRHPLHGLAGPLYPALLAGCAAVLAPDEHTPRAGRWLADQCAALFPPALVPVLVCAAGLPAAGSALLGDGAEVAVVRADAGLDDVVAAVAQGLGALGRVYVEAQLADALVPRLAQAVGRLRVAPQPNGFADLGPLPDLARLRA